MLMSELQRRILKTIYDEETVWREIIVAHRDPKTTEAVQECMKMYADYLAGNIPQEKAKE